MSVTPTIDEGRKFLGRLAVECAQNDVRLILDPGESIESDGIHCAGWFGDGRGEEGEEDADPELVIALGCDVESWFLTALHEYQHMRQWIEDPELFAELEDGETLVFKWLNKEVELSDKDLQEAIQKAVTLEGDCERRVLAMLDREDWNVDRDEYAQKGSAYAHFYRSVARTQRWHSSGCAPYALEEVWKHFPKWVDPNWQPSEHYYELYQKCYITEDKL